MQYNHVNGHAISLCQPPTVFFLVTINFVDMHWQPQQDRLYIIIMYNFACLYAYFARMLIQSIIFFFRDYIQSCRSKI